MGLHSGSKDLTLPSIMLMRLLHGTLLSSGKPPGRPPDSNLVRDISQHDAPSIDPGGIGSLEDKATMLGVLGRLKEEGDLLPTSSSPILISNSTPWKEEKGRNDLPMHTFGMGDFKDGSNHMIDISVDRSSILSLLESVDLYWKSQLLVDYSKDINACMILDDQLHEEGYLVQGGVIYHHGRIFLSIASKLKKKLLQRAYEEFFFSHTFSMKAYYTIMESYTWEGFEEELYQHFQICMNHV